MRYRVVVIGASTGGLEAIRTILKDLSMKFPASILVAQHLSPRADSYMAEHLDRICCIKVKEADDKERIVRGTAYIAPPNYHMLVEKDETLSLTVGRRVNYARPSIDVLFESAAEVFQDKLIGVILTGANSDGSNGLRKVKELGGITIVQSPDTAEASYMPRASIEATEVDYILKVSEISRKLIELIGEKHEPKR